MGRPMRKITGEGAVANLRRRLQLLQRGSGLTLEDLTYKTGMSKTDLSEMTGVRPPQWDDLVIFVRACGGHPDDYRSEWTAARDEFTNSAAPGNSGRHLTAARDAHE